MKKKDESYSMFYVKAAIQIFTVFNIFNILILKVDSRVG